VLERLNNAADTVYAAPRLRASALAVLSRSIRPEFVPVLVTWYESPVGRRFTALEEATAAPGRDPQVVVQEGVALLKAASAERRAIFDRFMVVTKAAETIASLTINSAVAIQQGMAAAAPSGQRLSVQEVRAALEAQRPRLLQAYSGIVLASFASTYAGVDDAAMQEYVAFMQTPAGQHFTDLSMIAVERALLDAAAELGNTLGQARTGSTT
jgi:hypothetical protein